MSTELNTREVIKLQAKLIALLTKQYKPIGIMFIIVFSVLSFLFVAQNEHDILKLRQRLAINQKVLVDTRQSIIIKELDDGGLLLSSRIAHVTQILPLVRYWIPHLKIVNPESLQDEVGKGLKEYLDVG